MSANPIARVDSGSIAGIRTSAEMALDILLTTRPAPRTAYPPFTVAEAPGVPACDQGRS
uniref:Uncharacterized protein n=1 Tax=Streptomyces sp. NBC_00049 TaxID=2903617 RepID=A0AAU2JZC4_9ACTN